MTSHRAVAPESRAGWGFILLTLLLALMVKQLPWSGWALAVRPDFLLVVLLFWAQKRPSLVGMALAWPLGLFADIQDGIVLGQHALAYVVSVFLVQYFLRRLLQFSLFFQALQLFVILLVADAVTLAVGWTSGRIPQASMIFVAVPASTILWYVLARIGKMPEAAGQQDG
jgi:rod shape-determining protein MreD